MIYLDHNATTSVLPEVFEAMRPCSCEEWGTPPIEASPGKRQRLGQQRLEARLLKMTVPREGFGKTFILHHDKGNAVGKRPILVRPLGE
jgi:hypothetical protein